MTHIPLRLCVGCGRVFDEIQPKDGQPQWMDAHAYLMKYGFHWEDLDRTDDACPPCARVLAIARRGVHPHDWGLSGYPTVSRRDDLTPT